VTAARRLPRCSTRLRKLALDPNGDILIVDTENHAIRRFDPRAGIVMALAGGRKGPGGDGGRRPKPRFSIARMEQWSARTVRSISVTPTITASGNWCARPEWGGERQRDFQQFMQIWWAERCKSTVRRPFGVRRTSASYPTLSANDGAAQRKDVSMRVGLRTKLNLLIIALAILAIGSFALIATPFLESVARDEVLQAIADHDGERGRNPKYTSEEIAPVLAPFA